MRSQQESSFGFISLGALNHEFYPRVDPTKRQKDLLFVSPCQLVIGYRLFLSLTLGLGTDLHYLLGEVASILKAEGKFSEKGVFVNCRQPTPHSG